MCKALATDFNYSDRSEGRNTYKQALPARFSHSVNIWSILKINYECDISKESNKFANVLSVRLVPFYGLWYIVMLFDFGPGIHVVTEINVKTK